MGFLLPAGFYYCVAASCGSHCIGCCGWWITYFETASDTQGTDIVACTSAGCKTKNIMIVGVESVTADKTSCCADDPEGILFTATSKPAGQTMRCIYWQYRYRANPNVQWDDTYWGTLTDSYGKTQYRLTAIWGAGYYQMRAINGDADYSDAYAISPEVKSQCDPDLCETCVNGSCLSCGGDLDMVCCLDGTETCCNWVIGEICCNGDCCNRSCCDSFDCEHCVSGSCEPCLRKVGTYAELQQCSNIVDDPDTKPSPNGCGPGGDDGISDNPAEYACGEASSFKNACDAHDTCYQTCGSNRIEKCDTKFDWDLWNVCNPLSGECRDACLEKKSLYVGFALLGGEAYWRDDQVAACACCDCN